MILREIVAVGVPATRQVLAGRHPDEAPELPELLVPQEIET